MRDVSVISTVQALIYRRKKITATTTLIFQKKKKFGEEYSVQGVLNSYIHVIGQFK